MIEFPLTFISEATLCNTCKDLKSIESDSRLKCKLWEKWWIKSEEDTENNLHIRKSKKL